jgi:hypothetical protein
MSMLFDEQQSTNSGDLHLSSQKITRLFQQWWHVITNPQKQTLSDEMGKATWKGVILQLLMLVIGTGLWFYLVSVMRSFPAFISSFPGVWLASLSLMAPNLLIPLLTVLLSIGILHGLALLFGGKGTLLQWTYTSLLFLVPLLLVEQILQTLFGTLIFPLLPFSMIGSMIGDLPSSLIIIYIGILHVFALGAVHRLNRKKAMMALLILVVLSLSSLWLLGIILI